MASFVARHNAVLVRHMRNLNSLLRRARFLSSSDGEHGLFHEKGDVGAISGRTWPDTELKTLDPYDHVRFPLPGDTAPSFGLHSPAEVVSVTDIFVPSFQNESDILTEPTSQERQALIYTQFNPARAELKSKAEASTRSLELKVQDCPLLVRKDFQDLFPGSEIMQGDFTIMSICQQTDADMTSWSADVEEERERLIELYVDTANEVCVTLRNAGFWADFIDPCSGKPFIGSHTTATMFETDERYRHFGFEIDDLGCCKVIKHHRWGSHAYVGCIFTNAPSTHPLLMEIAEADI